MPRRMLVVIIALVLLATVVGCDSEVYKAAKEGDVAALVQMAEDTAKDEFAIREVAVQKLGELGTPEAVDALLAWLEEGPPEGLYNDVLEALGATGDVRVIEPLLAELDKIDLSQAADAISPEETTKVWAIMRSLAKFPDERVADALLAQLDAGHVIAISEIELADALAGQGEAIAPALEQRLASADELIYRPAALALGSIYAAADKESRIVELLKSPATFRIYPAVVDGPASVDPQAVIDSLNAVGDVPMAQLMLNSSLEEWNEAAKAWAAAHGYMIETWIKAP